MPSGPGDLPLATMCLATSDLSGGGSGGMYVSAGEFTGLSLSSLLLTVFFPTSGNQSWLCY